MTLLRFLVILAAAAVAGCDSKNSSPGSPSDTPTALTISPLTDFLKLKATERFVANAQLSGGSTKEVTAQWGSDTVAVVTVDSGGLVTAVGVGSSTIIADYQGLRATRLIQVLPDYAGRWSGDFVVTSCSGSGALKTQWCGRLMASPAFPARLDLVQTRSAVSGSWTLQEDATGSVTGTIEPGGHLALQGSAYLGGVTVRISSWDSNTIDNQGMTGHFSLTWTATGLNVTTKVSLRDFRRSASAA